MRKVKKLIYCCIGAKRGHPQKVMLELGIKYQHATPQSMGDCWWFWNPEAIPNELPSYLKIVDADPFESVGYGLSVEMAQKIVDQAKRKELGE